MQVSIQIKNLKQTITFDTANGISLTQKVARNVKDMPNAYYLKHPRFEPVISGTFIGDVRKGGACNCEDVFFNPHGNGTHTECVGHISVEKIHITEAIIPEFMLCYVYQAKATNRENGDKIIDTLPNNEEWKKAEAFLIHSNETHRAEYFSGKNPCYINAKITDELRLNGINHLLTDLPSVDREEDGGLLEAHKSFFNYPEEKSMHKTITELVCLPKGLKEGLYLVKIAPGPIESDAAPSNVVLYPFS